MTTLTFHRTTYGYRATTADFVYDLHRPDSNSSGSWYLRASHAAHVLGITITDPSKGSETVYADTARDAKRIAAHYEANTNADQTYLNRMTRATAAAYDEEA